MKENELTSAYDEQEALARRLQERALLTARPQAGDRLMLADATLLAALDGSRVLTPNERAALAASPLTLRRFRHLSLQRQGALAPAAGQPAAVTPTALPQAAVRSPAAANDAYWTGSSGLLRAASSAVSTLAALVTDDNCWTLHFVEQGDGWQVILALSAQAPFAARLLNEQPLLRVIDGGGAIVLQGRLDADGECERAWPFSTAPASHFQLYGASFAVQPVAP
jgi:hypothetical protein